jgi:hypothetical protein
MLVFEGQISPPGITGDDIFHFGNNGRTYVRSRDRIRDNVTDEILEGNSVIPLEAESGIETFVSFAFENHGFINISGTVSRIYGNEYLIVGSDLLGSFPAVTDIGSDIRIVVGSVEIEAIIGKIHSHVLSAVIVIIRNRLSLIVYALTGT